MVERQMAKIVRFFIQMRDLVCCYLLQYRSHLDIVPMKVSL